jgi:hypothetical protein
MRMLLVAAVAAAGFAASPAFAARENPGQERATPLLTLVSNRQQPHPQTLCQRGYHWGRYCFKPTSVGCLAWSSYRCVRNH